VLYDQTKTCVSNRVLLVDDDDAVCEMMNLALEAKGFQVILPRARRQP
jgi:DNA-binding response OmpR family regulator